MEARGRGCRSLATRASIETRLQTIKCGVWSHPALGGRACVRRSSHPCRSGPHLALTPRPGAGLAQIYLGLPRRSSFLRQDGSFWKGGRAQGGEWTGSRLGCPARLGDGERIGGLWCPRLHRERQGDHGGTGQPPREVPCWASEESPGSFTSHSYTETMRTSNATAGEAGRDKHMKVMDWKMQSRPPPTEGVSLDWQQRDRVPSDLLRMCHCLAAGL